VAKTLDELQRHICQTYGAAFDPPVPSSKVGIALQTMSRIPINGMRIPPTETTCGWYIYAGEECSSDPHFYQPMCLEHLERHCRFALPFVCLPPGWRFLTDGRGYIDAWFDEQLLGQDTPLPTP
jgi:hypothetical protein